MAKRTESAFTEQPRTGGRHLAREGAAKTKAPSDAEKQSSRRREQSTVKGPAEKGATKTAKRREGVRRGDLPPVRRPACRPKACTGTMSLPHSATRPWAGRTNLTEVTPSASW